MKKQKSKYPRITSSKVLFAFKKEERCCACNPKIKVGEPYFNIVLYIDYYDRKKLKICKKCFDKFYKNEYLKEGGYGEWLKKKIVKKL
jgi:hypothetical protein